MEVSIIQYRLDFGQLCERLKLGELIGVPTAVAGGLLHRMYAVETTTGRYAIKALNPQIMLRPNVMMSYVNSERIARVAATRVPALPAKLFDNGPICEVNNQYYMVFDWIEGQSLKGEGITVEHAARIGSILADIHNTDFSHLGLIDDNPPDLHLVDWDFYLREGQRGGAIWAAELNEVMGRLVDWTTRCALATPVIARDRVLSHRDLDPKNVMWQDATPVIIDWESAGYVNPQHELLETAIYWAETEARDIDEEKFLACVRGYTRKRKVGKVDWPTVLAAGYAGKLGWLEYSLKRSLRMECADTQEQELGTKEVGLTLRSLQAYAAMGPKLIRLLNSVEEY